MITVALFESNPFLSLPFFLLPGVGGWKRHRDLNPGPNLHTLFLDPKIKISGIEMWLLFFFFCTMVDQLKPMGRLEMGTYWGILVELWVIMVELWGIVVELWGIKGECSWNCGELWGILGELWGIMGELWGIMRNPGLGC